MMLFLVWWGQWTSGEGPPPPPPVVAMFRDRRYLPNKRLRRV